MLKNVIIFLAGAAVGGGVTAFLLYDRLNKKFEKESDAKVASMEEYVKVLREKTETLDAELHESEEWRHKLSKNYEGEVDEGKIKKDLKESTQKNMPRESSWDSSTDRHNKVDYSQFYKQPDPEEYLRSLEHPEDDESQDSARDMTERANSKERPKLIRADEFDEYPDHDKVQLYYYTEDGTLTTEDDEIVDDPVAVIGDALTKYGFADNDEQVIYVRNMRLGTDYEIAKVFGGFMD